MLAISRFPSLRSTAPEPAVYADLAELAAHLGQPRPFARKDAAPLWSPVRYRDGASRGREGVASVSLGVLDLDQTSPDVAVDALASRGVAFLLHTSWSHAVGRPCLRLVVAFDRPVDRAAWSEVWPRLNALCGGVADRACSDESRVYYVPSYPASAPDPSIYFAHLEPGRALPLEELLAVPAPEAARAAPGAERRPVTLRDLKALARSMRSRRGYRDLLLADQLSAISSGESFAEPGARHNDARALTLAMARAWPTADGASVAALFESSLRKMGPDAPSADEIASLFEGALSLVEEEVAAREAKVDAKRRARLGFVNRSELYSEDEIDAFVEFTGGSREALTYRWIVQRGSSYYFLTERGYSRAYQETEAGGAARDFLVPAASAGVELNYFQPRTGQIVAKTIRELVYEYGVVAQSCVADLKAQVTWFDGSELVEACCPLRDYEPARSEVVERWLELLAPTPELHAELLTWIAALTSLDRACAALYLQGPKGAGKSLLARGLSHLWTTEGPTTLESAMSSFNEDVMRCPLLFADEAMPKDFQGAARTDGFRVILQEPSRSLRRKYIPEARLLGYVRVMIAANNPNVLATAHGLTQADVAALTERVLHVSIPSDTDEKDSNSPARRYLSSVPDIQVMVDELIPRHALWLRDNYQWRHRRERFIVSNPDNSFHRGQAVSHGTAALVCRWLCSYLAQPSKIDSQRRGLVCIREGKLLVNPRGIAENWAIYLTQDRVPTLDVLSKAIADLSSRQVQLRVGTGYRTRYWVIDLSNIKLWAERTDFVIEGEIDERLSHDTPDLKLVEGGKILPFSPGEKK